VAAVATASVWIACADRVRGLLLGSRLLQPLALLAGLLARAHGRPRLALSLDAVMGGCPSSRAADKASGLYKAFLCIQSGATTPIGMCATALLRYSHRRASGAKRTRATIPAPRCRRPRRSRPRHALRAVRQIQWMPGRSVLRRAHAVEWMAPKRGGHVVSVPAQRLR
jgi:hypothetical protein